MGIQNAEIYTDFESVEKFAKTHAKKVISEKEFLLLLWSGKLFDLKLFSVYFLHFFQWIQTQHLLLLFMEPI
jgi:hypothetical protein